VAFNCGAKVRIVIGKWLMENSYWRMVIGDSYWRMVIGKWLLE